MESLARLEPPPNVARRHARQGRALNLYAPARVTRRGSGDPPPVPAAIQEARQVLKLAPERGKPT